MPSCGSGRGSRVQPPRCRVHPGRCWLAALPALAPQLEPGLTLSTLSSCPDTLPRRLGH